MEARLVTYKNTVRFEVKLHPWEEWYKTAFLHRNTRTISLGYQGRGINFHRRGGISITGLPSSGGTTLCWGGMRRKIRREKEVGKDAAKIQQTTLVRNYGPLMIRVGEHF